MERLFICCGSKVRCVVKTKTASSEWSPWKMYHVDIKSLLISQGSINILYLQAMTSPQSPTKLDSTRSSRLICRILRSQGITAQGSGWILRWAPTVTGS